jgi:hypothetical protein
MGRGAGLALAFLLCRFIQDRPAQAYQSGADLTQTTVQILDDLSRRDLD